MKNGIALLAVGLALILQCHAHGATPPALTSGPIDIIAEGSTSYQNELAIATKNVVIQSKNAYIFADYAAYNRRLNEVLLVGNVRIYRADNIVSAQRAVYNFGTQSIRALDFRAGQPPYFFRADSVFSPGAGYQYNAQGVSLTTHDSSKPDYHLTAKRLRIYPDDRVILIGSTLYIGTTPVFYFPYFYQSLDEQGGYQILPGYSSLFGAYLGLAYSFPITRRLSATPRLDYRSLRGVGGGLSLDYHLKPTRAHKTAPNLSLIPPFASDDDPGVPTNFQGDTISQIESTGSDSPDTTLLERDNNPDRDDIHFLSYYLYDKKPDLNRTALPRLPTVHNRYRFALNGTKYLTDDLTLKTNFDKLSDRYMLEDFYPGEFTRNPQPDNVAFFHFYHPDVTANFITRAQLNPFFSTTERLPELTIDLPRHPLFTIPGVNTTLNYENESSVGHYSREFPTHSLLPEYSAYRADTFHQLTLPGTYFDWLSIVPRIGIRGTYYSHRAPESRQAYNLVYANEDAINTLFNSQFDPPPGSTDALAQEEVRLANKNFKPGGAIWRPAFNTGIEGSFKVSKIYDQFQNRLLGLDQLHHVVQPYVNFSYVDVFGVNSRQILPFDRLLPTTQLNPIDFPLYTPIDTIDTGTFMRVGVHNTLQTYRDALTFNWLEVNSYFQVNIHNPYSSSHFSNLFHEVTFRPLPWLKLEMDAQFPFFDHATNVPDTTPVSTSQKILDFLDNKLPINAISGFTVINTSLAVQPISTLELDISHRYLHGNPFFKNSNLLAGGAYFQIDPNWAFSFAEQYEFKNSTLQAQNYTLYRDLSSFVASLSFGVRDNYSGYSYVGNKSVKEYGVMLNLTLKGVPQFSLPLGFGPSTTVGLPSINR